jgi:hypothetical protein
MVFDSISVTLNMRPLTHITLTLLCGVLAFGHPASAGTPALSTAIPAYDRDAKGIALAVTELLPSIDNCVSAHQALGGAADIAFDIAFQVSPEGEIAKFTIDSKNAPTTGVDSCIEGTLSALRFAPGTQSIPVQMPLTASASTENTIH